MLPPLPPPFIRQMQALLGTEWPLLEAALQTPPPVSIRLNPRKALVNGHWTLDNGHWTLDVGHSRSSVPWHPHGIYLHERPVFTLDPTFHAGAYYVQEASSMFIYEALRQTVDFSKPLKVLDLCAAPGGKSTLMADLLAPDSLLISNETIRPRTASLRENLERWGNPNVAVTSGEVEELAALEGWFDVVLADAPCSGEGLFRKDPDAMREWSLPQVEFCAGRQKRILSAAVQALKPGGILLFSTCTYNAQENTENARWLAQTFDLQAVAMDIPGEWGIVQSELGCQFYPHKVQGEGFYLAVFRKTAGEVKKHTPAAMYKSIKPLSKHLVPAAAAWLSPKVEARFFLTPSGEVLALPAVLEPDFLLLDKFLKTKWFGVNIGEFKGKDFIPSHALALSLWASPDLPAVDLSREQALLFLKKETFDPPSGAPLGWTLARYKGLNLGWLKILPNRLNNYLPQERRIRMAIGTFTKP
ncbi:MAG: methyltransferase RsmF C-terminal domain-like protein [Saprospiraceae bacterium]